MTVTGGSRKRAARIRAGVLLVVLSWVPIAQVIIWSTGASSSRADEIRATVWSIQVVVGLIGVAVAGRETVAVAKSVGWRRMPRAVWALLLAPDGG